MVRVNMRRRLAALEDQFTGEPIVLQMPDGRTKTLPGNQATGLLARSVQNERTPDIELVARRVSSTEPGGGQMIDLARAILNSPVEETR